MLNSLAAASTPSIACPVPLSATTPSSSPPPASSPALSQSPSLPSTQQLKVTDIMKLNSITANGTPSNGLLTTPHQQPLPSRDHAPTSSSNATPSLQKEAPPSHASSPPQSAGLGGAAASTAGASTLPSLSLVMGGCVSDLQPAVATPTTPYASQQGMHVECAQNDW